MVCVTQDTNGARLHHHSQRKIQRILEPPFGESPENMAMSDLKSLSACFMDESNANENISSYQQDIRSTATVQVWFL